jgi:predicted phage terminase large subunit-like protein
MNPLEVLFLQFPHLASPAALMLADTSQKYEIAPHIALMNTRLLELATRKYDRLAVNLPYQHSKLLAHSTPIWTTQGWKTHGELRVGDYVYSPDGLPVRVIAVAPEDGVADHEVETTDGHTIKCNGKHEWYVRDRRAGRNVWRIRETEEFLKKPLREYEPFVGARWLMSLPRPLPLEAAHRGDLLVPPYVLGAWLGDGQNDVGVLSHDGNDMEVVQEIARQGFPITSRWIQKTTGVCYAYFGGLVTALRAEGLLHNKHIPEKYLTASKEQRMELLAGLIDTDGNWSERSGQYRFTNTNRALIDATALLARSLGFKVGKLQQYDPPPYPRGGIQGKKRAYVLAWTATATIPCRIPRKVPRRLREACLPSIKSVRKIDNPEPGRCIQVEGGLYLAGEGLTCTHNSTLVRYFLAWMLLIFPELRVIYVAATQELADVTGSSVKEILSRWGKELGVELTEDTKAKANWMIATHKGGLLCRGVRGSIIGRPADILILDDLVKGEEQAHNPNLLEAQWQWYIHDAYGRLGPDALVVAVGTRWTTKDFFGHIRQEERAGGEQWQWLVLRAIATDDDPLGRKPGEALWPRRVPLKRLQMIQRTRGRAFAAGWQQAPEDDEGSRFKPREWPRFSDVGDAFALHNKDGSARRLWGKHECTTITTLDWAWSEKTTADYSVILTARLTPDGNLLIIDVVRERIRLEGLAPRLAQVCAQHHPALVGVEVGHPTLSREYQRYPSIPEVRWLRTEGRSKLTRALPAIVLGENHRIYLPLDHPDWLEDYLSEMAAFTGLGDDHDDQVDATAWAAQLAQSLRHGVGAREDAWPEVLVPGKEVNW